MSLNIKSLATGDFAPINALPEDLRDAARKLLVATDLTSSTAVDRFGAGTIAALETEMQRASSVILAFDGVAIHAAIGRATALLTTLDPHIHRKGLIVRLIYAVKSLPAPGRVAKLRAEFDALAVTLARHREALVGSPAPLRHIQSEVEVGAAVMAAAADWLTAQAADPAGHDAAWLAGQIDRVIARQAMFDTLSATVMTQLNTLEAHEAVTLRLVNAVDVMAKEVLPAWASAARLVCGFNAVFAATPEELATARSAFEHVARELPALDRMVVQAEHEPPD